MRLLFLTNFYPPLRGGGYAQLCQEVAQMLRSRGHSVTILTSNYQQEQAPVHETGVYRLFHLEGDLFYYRPIEFLLRWRKHQKANRLSLLRIVSEFEPEAIIVWGMWALSTALPALCEQLLPSRIVYYLADYWPVAEDMHRAFWRQPAQRWFTRWPRHLLSRLALAMLVREGTSTLKFEHSLCVSAALRDALLTQGAPLKRVKVIHNGIQVEQFLNSERSENGRFKDGRWRLLYAGQVVPHKGVHTAVTAMSKLVREKGLEQLSLTILGSGHPDYEESLRTLVERESLGNYVTFHSPVARNEMPAVMGQFDMLIFPSIYGEPLARIVQEAMAAGLVVVGTTTGGTKEILVDGENGLTFSPEDAAGLAGQIAQLVADPDLYGRLARAGRQTVQEKFTMSRMVVDLENYLQEVVYSAHSISY